MALEDLQDQLGEKLLDLSVEQLKTVCIEVKVSAEKETKRHVLLRLINQSIETVIEEEESDVAENHLNRLLKLLEALEQGVESEPNMDREAEELAALKKQYESLQLSFQSSTQALSEEIERLSGRVEKKKTSRPPDQQEVMQQPPQNRLPEVTIRR